MRNSLHELSDRLPLAGLVSVPPAPERRERWPLLVFLHGYDEAAPLALRQALTRHGPLRPGNPAVATDEFVVVAPQLPRRGDLWNQLGARLAVTLDEVEAEWRGDPERVYLTGFSYGANGVLDLAARRAYPFAALWAVDPTRIPAGDPQLPLWLSSGAACRGAARTLITRLRLRENDLVGDRVYEDAGVDHVTTAGLAYADARVYRWLLKHRRRAVLAPLAHLAHTDVS